MKEKTCCFTGHREIRKEDETGVKSRIREQALALLAEGYAIFLAGGARGFDMLAAETVLELREREGKDLRLVSVLPCPDWREGWAEEEIRREDSILERSDEISFSGEKDRRRSFLDRDRKMVDGASVCVAWCTRRSGGTAYTVRYALKQGVRVINLADRDIGEMFPAK